MPDLLPPPPDVSFASDNAAGVHPAVLDALAAANSGAALAYGDDPWTRGAEDDLRQLFDAPVETVFCWGGTGANIVGLAAVLQPWQAVITPDSAHIVVDECGGPVRFTGSSICPVVTPDGKLRPDQLAPFVHWLGSEHHPQPAVVSVSQASELGTVYDADELAALAEAAHRHGLLLHVDGARIANAVVATGQPVTALLRDTGVDVLTFGLTKNGAMFGDAVVFLRPDLAERARFVRKQAGQLVSKSRFVGAQVRALLADDLWLRNAQQANFSAALLAQQVAGVPGVELLRSPEVNAVFARLPRERIAELQAWSFFWEWDADDALVRWMTSYVTTDEDIRRFVAGVESIIGGAS